MLAHNRSSVGLETPQISSDEILLGEHASALALLRHDAAGKRQLSLIVTLIYLIHTLYSVLQEHVLRARAQKVLDRRRPEIESVQESMADFVMRFESVLGVPTQEIGPLFQSRPLGNAFVVQPLFEH